MRRAAGCVLLDRIGHVIATGYNGVSKGQRHCNEEVVEGQVSKWEGIWKAESMTDTTLIHYPYACQGAGSPSGSNLDACQAIHAESNALLQCRDVWQIWTCYTTVSPCMWCVRLLLNTSCERIVFLEEYPHAQAREEWLAEVDAVKVPGGVQLAARRSWECVRV